MPELKELVEAYKPSIIWSDGVAGLSSWDEGEIFFEIHCRARYLLERHWISRMALQ